MTTQQKVDYMFLKTSNWEQLPREPHLEFSEWYEGYIEPNIGDWDTPTAVAYLDDAIIWIDNFYTKWNL